MTACSLFIFIEHYNLEAPTCLFTYFCKTLLFFYRKRTFYIYLNRHFCEILQYWILFQPEVLFWYVCVVTVLFTNKWYKNFECVYTSLYSHNMMLNRKRNISCKQVMWPQEYEDPIGHKKLYCSPINGIRILNVFTFYCA